MKVGIQLYSVKEHLMKDGLGTMKAVAEAGYKYIEPFCSARFPIGEAEKGYGLGLTRQEAKALGPISATPAGMSTAFSFTQPQKA